jgi:hypothetical protein
MWPEDFPFINSVSPEIEKEYRGQGFILKNAVNVILPVGSRFYGDEAEDFDQGELSAEVSEIAYSIRNNEISIELSLFEMSGEDDNLKIKLTEKALVYLLNPKHGWIQGDEEQ